MAAGRANLKEFNLTLLRRFLGRWANGTDTVCIERHLMQLKHGCALVAAKVPSSLKGFPAMFLWEMGQLKGSQVNNVRAVHWETG